MRCDQWEKMSLNVTFLLVHIRLLNNIEMLFGYKRGIPIRGVLRLNEVTQIVGLSSAEEVNAPLSFFPIHAFFFTEAVLLSWTVSANCIVHTYNKSCTFNELTALFTVHCAVGEVFECAHESQRRRRSSPKAGCRRRARSAEIRAGLHALN